MIYFVREQVKQLNKIFNNYDYDNQVKKLNEEFYELTEQLIKHKTFRRIGTRGAISSEMADVYILMEQFKREFNIPDEFILEDINYKLNRQEQRINKSKE